VNNSFAAAVATVTGGSDPSVQPSAAWVPFPQPAGGTITSIIPGEGITGGGSTGNVTITNAGVRSVVGTGITVGGVNDIALTNEGVIELTAGTNVSITGTRTNYTINAENVISGVQSVTTVEGSGITIGGTLPNPTVLNSGIISFNAGSGILNSGDDKNPNISNAGVLELTAGTNISLTGDKSNYTINSTASGGVQSVTTMEGSGISIGGTVTNPTVSNSGILSVGVGANGGLSVTSGPSPVFTNEGVLQISQGTNITITGDKTNYTISAASPPAAVQSITAGSGISVGGTSEVPIVGNTGVLELTSGSGIVLTGSTANYTIAATAPTFDLNAVLNKLNAFPVLPYTASSSQTVAANQVATVTVPDGSFPTASADGHWAFSKAVASAAYFNWYMYNPRFGAPTAPLPLIKSNLQSCWALIRPTVNLYLAGYLGFNIYSYDPLNPPLSGFYNTRWAYSNPAGVNSGLSGTNLYAGYTYLIYANDAPRTQNSFAIGVPDSQVSGFRDPYDIYTDVNHIAISQCVVAFNPWTNGTNYKTWTSAATFVLNDIVVYAGNSGNAAGYNGLFYRSLVINNNNHPPMTVAGVTDSNWALLDPQPSSYKDQPVLAAALVQSTASVQAVGYVVLDMGFSYGTSTTTTSVSQHVSLTAP